MIFVYVTCENEKQAKDISKKIVEKRLAACSNMFPIDSIYWWKGKLIEEKGYVIILKTIDKNFALIKREVEKLHSYEVPCIKKIKVEANKKCEDWVNKTVK